MLNYLNVKLFINFNVKLNRFCTAGSFFGVTTKLHDGMGYDFELAYLKLLEIHFC